MEKKETKQKPDPSDVRDTLITAFCYECPDHRDDTYCADHKCIIWTMFGIITEVEEI
jgi:hypothetical protein